METKQSRPFLHLLLLLMLIGTILVSCKKSSTDETTADSGPIPKTTKIIESSVWQNNIVAFDTSTYTFTFKKEIVNTMQLAVDNILVSGQGDGCLRRIAKIESDGNNVKVYTSFASINEAIRDGSFNIQSVLSQNKIKSIKYYRSGIKIDTSRIKSGVETNIDATLDEYLDPDKKVHLTGSFSLGPSFNCDLVIKMFKVDQFRMEYEIGEQINLECTMELLNVQLSKEIKLAKITFNPISFFIGPVPVVVTPELELSVGANLKIQSKVTTSVDQQMSYKVGVAYENNTWTPFQEKTNSFTFQPPTLTAKATAKAYIKPQLNVKFYGTLAPYVYGEAYLRMAADFLGAPLWTLYGGAKVGAGVKMDIFGKEVLDWPDTPFYLFEYEKEITNSTNFQNNQPPALPSAPQPLNNQTNVPLPVILSWQCTDPENDPLTYDIYFGTNSPPPLVQSNVTSLSFNPGTLLEDKTYYWKIIARDDHSNITPGVVWNFQTKSAIVNQPTVSTSIITGITQTTATGGGDVTSDGGATVTARGVCWSTTVNPTISNSYTTDGAGIGTFISSVTGLSPATIYHVRAYATNSEGTSYGSDIQFTTDGSATSNFVNEFHNLDNNLIPSGWELIEISPEVILENGRLTAKIIDSYGYLGRVGTIPSGTLKMIFQWDGSLISTFWGMSSQLRIDFGDNKYLRIYAAIEGANPLNDRVVATYFDGSNETDIFQKNITGIYDTYHFNLELLPSSVTFSAISLSSGANYFNETITIPTNTGFSFAGVNSVKFIANATTENDCWIDNISISVIH